MNSYAKAGGKYLLLEDRAISLVRGSFIASIFRKLFRLISLISSGCFITVLAGEDRYALFASHSVIVNKSRDIIHPFERSLSRNYAASFTASFFSAVASRGVDWRSARKDSWFLSKIYHA